MAIGPESRRRMPGRLLVTSTLYAIVGLGTLVAGLGPLVEPSEVPAAPVIGLAGVLGGMLLLLSAALVLGSSGRWRTWGKIGGALTVAAGASVALLAMATVGNCAAAACSVITVGAGLAGIAIVAAGVAAALTVRRMANHAWQGRRRRAREHR